MNVPADWPLARHSKAVAAGGLVWHVQRLGEGPALLLVHGTGAATHSWRALAPLLADRFALLLVDLPGHGFTSGAPARGLGLPQVAGALADLLDAEEFRPALACGHSAGAAILARMAIEGRLAAPILGFCAALLPFGGAAAPLFSGLARLLLANPIATRLFARLAGNPERTRRFLARATGSAVDAQGAALYARLFARPAHVAGAMRMMAAWDLAPLARDLPRLPVKLRLVHGRADAAVPERDARRAAARAGAAFTLLDGLGHLAHEEAPARAAELIVEAHAGRGWA
jgi:magnesium chelatase accessory protein